MTILFATLIIFSAAWFPYVPVPVYAVSPDPPTSLNATAVSTTQIILSWTSSSVNNTIQATGGSVTTSSGRTIHTFTTNGTYQVTAGSGNVSVLVVAGGGSGSYGGGGGGGGVLENSSYPISTGNYNVIVGAGGASGGNGHTSSFGSMVSIGGGAGGANNGGPGSSGGSGGGGGYNTQGTGYAGGAGTSSQGYAGGNGMTYAGGLNIQYTGSGGGAGGNGGSPTGGACGSALAGNGVTSTISGSSVTYGGGGAGAGYGCNTAGGSGGGGGVSGSSSDTGSNGAANTGGGGGGEYISTGGNGGSGIVIVSEVTSGPVVTGYKIERSLNNSTWNTIVSNTGSTSTTYSNTGLNASTLYYYRVSGINSDGISLPSHVASATTLSSGGGNNASGIKTINGDNSTNQLIRGVNGSTTVTTSSGTTTIGLASTITNPEVLNALTLGGYLNANTFSITNIGDIKINSGNKLYLDGGSSNYITYDNVNNTFKIIPSANTTICIGSGC